MNRREFLKSALSAAALAAIPAPIIAAFESGETDTLTYGDISLTYHEGAEYAIQIDAAGHSANEVYQFMIDQLR